LRDRVYRTEAIVIRRSDAGEADRLITILTPHGRQRVVARGARKIHSRLAGHIELFTHTMLMLAIGRNLHIVTQSSPLDRFERLRTDLERIGAAYYAAELVDRLVEEDAENKRAFSILLGTLRALDAGAAIDLTLRAYELHLLDALGYRPQLYECAACGAVLTEATNRFSPVTGGALCLACAGGGSPGIADESGGIQTAALPSISTAGNLRRTPHITCYTRGNRIVVARLPAPYPGTRSAFAGVSR
jgi:DNA repair protein RecO (recombination protein O)